MRSLRRAPRLLALPPNPRADHASAAGTAGALSAEPETRVLEAVAHAAERRTTIPEAEIRAVALGHAPGRYGLSEIDAAVARLVRGGELIGRRSAPKTGRSSNASSGSGWRAIGVRSVRRTTAVSMRRHFPGNGRALRPSVMDSAATFSLDIAKPSMLKDGGATRAHLASYELRGAWRPLELAFGSRIRLSSRTLISYTDAFPNLQK